LTQYADYQFYQAFTEDEAVFTTASCFDKYAIKATQYIDRYTFGNIKMPLDNDVHEKVKACCCELAEKLYSYDEQLKKGVTSESVGDLSVHYESSVAITQRTSQEIKEIIHNWLANTGLMYRGV
jgi:hypothetical protein